MTPRRARAADLQTPTAGARLLVGATELRDGCAAFALMLPTASAFSHLTAARLLGLPLPWWADDLIHAIVPPGTQARRQGLVAHRHTLAERDVFVLDGIRVTNPARTFCDLGELLDLTALTVAGDHLAHALPVEAIHEILSRYRARRGRLVIRAALALIDPRSESPKETELRLVLLGAGFGPFDLNRRLFDDAGEFVARVDLALPRLRIAIEYEGDHHRNKDQWRHDIARRRRIEALGWIYIPVTQADLVQPVALLRDLRAAIASR